MSELYSYINRKYGLTLRIIGVLWGCMCTFSPALAYNFWTIGTQEGLSQLSVLGLCQDRIGRMWFGTDEGLNMFDGNHLTVYHSNSPMQDMPEGSLDFLGNSNYPIVEDRNGDLFFKSDNSLIKYDLGSQSFMNIAYKGFFSLAACDGEIWMGTSRYVYKVVDDSLQTVYGLDYAMDAKSLYVRDSIVWVGGENELLKIDLRKNLQETVLKACVWSIYKDGEDRLWIATRKNGVYRIEADNRLVRINIGSDGRNSVTPNEVRCFVEDGKGNLWIGTFNGLVRYNLTTHQTIRLTIRNGLPHNSIYALYADRNHNIWVGTYYGGVCCFNANENDFLYFLKDDLGTPFVGNMVEDNDQRLWICTEGAGLKCYHKRTHEFTSQPIEWTVDGVTTVHPNLKTLCFDRRHNMLYIGTTTGGLCRYSLDRGQFKHYNLDKGISSMLGSSVDKVAMYGDYLILQVRRGLYKMHLPTEKISPLIEGKNYHNRWVRTFTVDSKGYIWIAGYNDIRIVNLNSTDEVYKIGNTIDGLGRYPVTCITEAPQGDMLVGTRGAGVYRCKDKRTFELVDKRFAHLFCYDVNFSRKGKMLVLTDKGVYVKDRTTDSIQMIGLQDYLSPLEAINVGCMIYVSKDSTIYVGGTKGMVAYNDTQLDKQRKAYDIYLSGLKVNGRKIDPRQRRVAFTLKRNSLKLEIGTTRFHNGLNEGKYRYMLEGYDADWRETSNAQVEYQNLPAGNFRLVIDDRETHHGQGGSILLQTESDNGNAEVVVYIIMMVLAALLAVALVRFRQRARKAAESMLPEQKEEDSRNKVHLADVNVLMEEFQKEVNLEVGEGRVFVYRQHPTERLYYPVNSRLLKKLTDKVVKFILDLYKDEQTAIEIIPCLKEDSLHIRIVDYLSEPVAEEKRDGLKALCSEEEGEEMEAGNGQEKAGENEIRQLCVENNAFIRLNFDNEFGADFIISIHSDEYNGADTGSEAYAAEIERWNGETHGVDHEFLEQVDKVIVQNLEDENFNINDIIGDLCMNRTSFYKKFKSETGFSPNEYLVCFRLGYARDLFVAYPDYQVADVAYRIGFVSSRYLGRCFKKRYGLSPGNYRKSFKQE